MVDERKEWENFEKKMEKQFKESKEFDEKYLGVLLRRFMNRCRENLTEKQEEKLIKDAISAIDVIHYKSINNPDSKDIRLNKALEKI